MTNPYTQPSLTGYNANPPPDDGTQTSNNALKWSNHINKIGDPLKTQLAAVDKNVSSAFTKVLGASISNKAANYTVVVADQGKVLDVTAKATITLLAAVTAGANFPLLIVNNSTDIVTVDADGSETINGALTITLRPDDSLLITCDGSKWIGAHSVALVEVIKFKTAAEGKTNDDVLANDLHLFGFNILPLHHYKVEAQLFYKQGIADFQFAMKVTADPDPLHRYSYIAIDQTRQTEHDVIFGVTPTASITTLGGGLECSLTLSGNFESHPSDVGLLSLQWAQDTSGASETTLREGSWLSVTLLD